MTVLASIGLSDVEWYSGKSRGYRLVPTIKKNGDEGKPKKEFLFLNLKVDSSEVEALRSVLKSLDPSRSIIKVVTIKGDFSGELSVPSDWEGRVFLEGLGVYPNITTLRRIGGRPNLMELARESAELPSVRYVGATLLEIEGVPVGRFDEGVAKEYGILGKDDSKIYHKEGQSSYDFFDEMPYTELEAIWGSDSIVFEEAKKVKQPKAPKIKIKTKKAKKVTNKSSSEPKKPKKPKVKVSKKKDAFSRIFSEKVEF